jgi:hypothetical protein
MITDTDTTMFEKVSNAFNFTVDKFPLSGPDGMKTPWYALFRSDNNQVVGNGSVTSRYVPHQTDDILAITEAASKVFDDEVSVDCHFRDGHFVTFAPSKERRKAIYGTHDNIFPRIVLRAGYDGTAFKASMGYFRDACSNLHIPRSVGIAVNVTIRHTSNLRKYMNELIADFRSLDAGWDSMVKQIQFMQNRNVQLVEFLNAIYPVPTEEGRGLTVHKNRTEAIVRRLLNERNKTGRPNMGSDYMVSAWEAFNAVQGYVQHDATRKSGFKNPMDRIILASKDAAVVKAEQLALAV